MSLTKKRRTLGFDFLDPPRSGRIVLEAEDVTLSAGDKQLLDGATIVVERGEKVGLVGPNGAGKTTTMKILATLLAPTAGEAYVTGIPVDSDPLEVRRRIGYMPDFYGVYDDLRVWEYLDFFGRCYGVPANRRGPMINELLEIAPHALVVQPYLRGWVARVHPDNWERDAVGLLSGSTGAAEYRDRLELNLSRGRPAAFADVLL